MTNEFNGRTLNQVLADRGITTSDGPLYAKHLWRDGRHVFTGDAAKVWEWLRAGEPESTRDE